ncbi:MAG: diguanylate cyclase [Nitrospirae bacterium CG_4_9_14_3_um_filter_53_35]|nr:MAG: diguanylate cyclase [Nitrospirae bacterium CG2_30_53_67]PIS37793.1 MAG: diguanylate cyclase [Nitrospirae bacterium CG08_land_8_20_14_0_20_52_24]PIV84997.1 MAG: diguanylate cyclase [Nitrospirae bacterium CG17_big_fil_post_rev_8_21_14_2_50_50_9]PIW85786.1 MAG: diguanylate cyclase [Nitrospirae bacterium CG_4_8_14_3_um_filter_50_41]PIX86734.1 MAG: diguanylate cyclase [Nitrospirae bacterium CG_4_10_14_3_um_filter_53_41]PJA73868.1 MAG: diguanylate cyclase [Nitrospirae bacterium CG_4_9_14_3_u
MVFFLAKRILMIFPMLLGITVITFIVIHLAPGSPTDSITELNPRASAQARENLKRLYGLDKPLHIQYMNWVRRLAMMDLGSSFTDGRKVLDKIRERLPITILINALSLFLIIMTAAPIGIISATRQYSLFDKATTVLVFIGFAMPTFWLALLLIILFGVQLGWLPISGLQSMHAEELTFWQLFWDRSRHLVLPIFVSSFSGLAAYSRYMRSSMLEVIRQDYIRTARAKGLPERSVIYKHALRNAMMSTITIIGLAIPGLIGGSAIFEQIFAIPGMGKLFLDATWARDYPVVMGILVIGAFLTLVGNFIADIAYAMVDPRIRVEEIG